MRTWERYETIFTLLTPAVIMTLSVIVQTVTSVAFSLFIQFFLLLRLKVCISRNNAAFSKIFGTQVYKCVGRKCAKNQPEILPETQITTTFLGAQFFLLLRLKFCISRNNAAFSKIFGTQVHKCVGRKCAKYQPEILPETQITTTFLGA